MTRENKKKEFGQFFTDAAIADFMADLALTPETNSILDPAVGKGVFLTSCLRRKRWQPDSLVAYDIDEEMIACVKAQFGACLSCYQKDYLLDFSDKRFDAIICNPPYCKFQNIEKRDVYRSRFESQYGVRLSGYTNLCTYFLIKSLNELKKGGRCIYIIPYEFLNTGYGKAVKAYLLKTRMLCEIYKFGHELNVFSDALTTACIFVFDTNENKKVDFIEIKDVEEIKQRAFHKRISYAYEELDPNEKWITYFACEKKTAYRNLIPFSSVATVQRGIATGSNAYFMLSKNDVKERGLSAQACLKCVAKTREVKVPVFTKEVFEALKESGKNVFLFDGTRAMNEADFSYLQYGEKKKVNEGYLTSHRTPWYLIENKKPAPIWISVFGRKDIKIVRNETDCRNLTAFHCVYVDDKPEEYINVLYCYLITPICKQILKGNKREYGGGLNKYEPGDLQHARILDISVLSKKDKEEALRLYERIRRKGIEEATIRLLNELFLKYLAPS